MEKGKKEAKVFPINHKSSKDVKCLYELDFYYSELKKMESLLDDFVTAKERKDHKKSDR